MNQSIRRDQSLEISRFSDSRKLVAPALRQLVGLACAVALTFATDERIAAQGFGNLPAMEDAFEAGAPTVEMGGGDFFSQDLGTLLRLRYNTESYGQDRRGNFDIGTMQVQSFEDAIAFFDGQVTLNDVNGVGYNLGVGFRWLHWSPFPIEPERITGFSFWTDGTSTESGNFFPQIGLSFESLGDRWDLRINGYIPVGQKSQLGSFTPTGTIGYNQNFLVEQTIADRNTSFYVAEAEIAARLMADRDAWAFAGPYTLVNDDEDTAGYRAGFRGYAYPDLLLQIAVSDDEIFKTNATFQVTWFVGRTRNNFQPACGLPDRMREPVMRNDYVALRRTTEQGGNPLTGTDGLPIRIVHVNSAAANGGNGTFENPLNDVGNVQANSIANDIVLLWSESIFQNQNTLALQNNQRLLGEGNGEFFTVNTQQRGTVVLPETSPGARDLARSIIRGTTGTGAVRLADTNEVANFNIDGTGGVAGAHGIFSPGTGAGNPNIHDIDFSNVSGTGIQFTPLTRPNTTNPALSTVAGNVTIDDVNFNNMGGVEIDINSFTTTDVTNPNVTLQETILISDVNSQEGSNIGIWLRNTHNARTATISNYVNGTVGTAGSGGGALASGVLVFEGTNVDDFDGDVTLTNVRIFNNTGYALHFSNISEDSVSTITTGNGLTWNGGTGAAGGMRFNNFDGTFTGNSSALSNGTLSGVRVTGTSDGTINLASTVTFDSIDPGAGEAIINIGPGGADSFTGSFTAAGAITNHDTGRLVSIQRVTAADAIVTLSGNMTDVANANSTGILVANNTDGTITFGGTLTIDTTGVNGIDLENNNNNADILFNGQLKITTDSSNARAFEATGGGTLTVAANNNEITTNGSAGVWIDGMAISNTGANFSKVNVASSDDNGVNLANNSGGPITIGTLGGDPGDSGTIENTVGDAVVINNSANVTVSSLQIDATAGTSGVRVNKSTNGTQTVNLNDLEINDGEIGIEILGTGNASATLNMTVNDTTINDPTSRGVLIDNVDAGTINFNNVTIDGDTANAGAQGVEIVGSNATINFDSQTSIENFADTSFEVDGGTGNVTYNGEITSTIGQSILVQNRSGGSVTFSSQSNVTDTGGGVRVTGNTAGTVNFNGELDLTTGANTAVQLTNNTGSTINFTPPGATPLDINTTSGNGFVATGGGTLNVAGTGNKISTATGRGLNIEGMTIGAVDFESVNVDGADNGIRLVNNTTGTITVGDTGAAVGAGGTLQNTTDQAVYIENSNVTLNGVTVENAGGAGENGVEVVHNNTTAMTVNLNRLTVTNAAANRNGVVIDGTGGTGTFNANLQNLNVNVTGNGLTVDDGVTLTAGGTNTITSATGVGLSVTDSTIGAAGANFQSVDVTAGATSGILLSNLTGGQIAVTGMGTNANTGGQLTTTGNAIVLTNVENVDLSNIRIVNSAVGIEIGHTTAGTTLMDVTITNLNLDDAANEGINVSADSDAFAFNLRLINSDIDNAGVVVDVTGAGSFGLLVDNTDISTDPGIGGRAFDFQIHDGATDVDATFRNDSNFVASDGEALFIDSFGATPKDVKINIQDSDFTDTLGTGIAADIRNRGTSLMQLTIQGNTFASAGAARDLSVASSGTAGSQIRLNLGGDVTDPADFNSAVGQGTLFVSQAGTSIFSIYQRDDTLNDMRNNQPVDTNGGTFQNLVIPPTLPTVP